ncbi:phage tail tube protein [Novosphingobium album (ex Liu et al. 2023)]|uniref:Phage tail tube protein n=1 Tax=Novosphingobium album (ex Liu et al. 2023) TaxID=3031130 RepID=A0ABT5WRI9_9SPHN|nr:phage tail tube protein [Novosphingobium album (ex Liu et al. 2023)]MDE8651882.1 phage tail tube protein [Novosphingobium album (ex Liu et al. 2023)]
MTTAAKTNFGKQLWMGPAAGVLVKVAELLTVTPPTITRETIDATSHDSTAGAQEFLVEGIYDPGEVPFQVHYIAGSTGDDAMITAVTDGVLRDFKIVVKSAAGTEDIEFSGYLTSYGPDEAPTTGKQTASGAIKVSGPLSQAASA